MVKDEILFYINSRNNLEVTEDLFENVQEVWNSYNSKDSSIEDLSNSKDLETYISKLKGNN